MLEALAVKTVGAWAAEAPLPVGWRRSKAPSGIGGADTEYIRCSNGQRSQQPPAEAFLAELLPLFVGGDTDGTLPTSDARSKRRRLAAEHLRSARQRADDDLLQWSGPYWSEDAAMSYYHHAGRKISIWHNPAEEWQAELALRRELLSRLLGEDPGAMHMALSLGPSTALPIEDGSEELAARSVFQGRFKSDTIAAGRSRRSVRAAVEGASNGPKLGRRRKGSSEDNAIDSIAEAWKAAFWRCVACVYRVGQIADRSRGAYTAVLARQPKLPCAGRHTSALLMAILAGVNVLLLFTLGSGLHSGSLGGVADMSNGELVASIAQPKVVAITPTIGGVATTERDSLLEQPDTKGPSLGKLSDELRIGDTASREVAFAAEGVNAHLESSKMNSAFEPFAASDNSQGPRLRQESLPFSLDLTVGDGNSESVVGAPKSLAATPTIDAVPRDPPLATDTSRGNIPFWAMSDSDNVAGSVFDASAAQPAAPPRKKGAPFVSADVEALGRLKRERFGGTLEGPPPPGPPVLFPLVQELETDATCCSCLDVNLRVEVHGLALGSAILTRAVARAQLEFRRLALGTSGPAGAWIQKESAAIGRAGSILTIGMLRMGLFENALVKESLDPSTDFRYQLQCGFGRGAGNLSIGEASQTGDEYGACRLEAASIFGLVVALESTLPQLFSFGGAARFRQLHLLDWPQYAVRGLMIDLGRRFVPKIALMKHVINGMALVRMNLLHLHLSDFCRFAIDLPRFPELNQSLAGGVLEGQYSLTDVRDILAYARDRGIMVLPEVDLPGHASGLLPLKNKGLWFCEPEVGSKPRPEESAKVFDDPKGESRSVLSALLADTAEAFEASDLRWFHIGGDEANPTGWCTAENIVSLESWLTADMVQKGLNMTPVGWEELRLKKPDSFGVKAVGESADAIIMPWRLGTARQLIRRGHRTVVANMENHYLDRSYTKATIESFWYDIAAPRQKEFWEVETTSCEEARWEEHAGTYLGKLAGPDSRGKNLSDAKAQCMQLGQRCKGVTCARDRPRSTNCEPRQGSPFLEPSLDEDSWVKTCIMEMDDVLKRDGLLGGISAMWTDKYCYKFQCGAAHAQWGELAGRLPTAGLMFARSLDESFGLSIAGMVWPRAAVTAAALWRFDASLPTAELQYRVTWIAALLRSHRVPSCPPGCTCDELGACDHAYPVLFRDRDPDRDGDAEQDLASACFNQVRDTKDSLKKAVDALGAVVANEPRSRSRGDALARCFWIGSRCVGVLCQGAPLGDASGDSGEGQSCRVHAGGVAPMVDRPKQWVKLEVLIKDLSQEKCQKRFNPLE